MRAREQLEWSAASLDDMMRQLSSDEAVRALSRTLWREASSLRREAGKRLQAAKTGRGLLIGEAAQQPRKRRNRKNARAYKSPPAAQVRRALAKTILAGVTKDRRGLYISVSATPYRKKAMYEGRHGLKPVAFWLNIGTSQNIKAADFIGETERNRLPGIQAEVGAEFQRAVERIISKKFSSRWQ